MKTIPLKTELLQRWASAINADLGNICDALDDDQLTAIGGSLKELDRIAEGILDDIAAAEALAKRPPFDTEECATFLAETVALLPASDPVPVGESQDEDPDAWLREGGGNKEED